MSRKPLWTRVALLLSALALAALLALWSGAYNIAADAPHYRLTYALLETLRERSIAVRAAAVQAPAEFGRDPAQRQRAAGNYEAMCAGCHLAPGKAPTELSRGLYPRPPNLAQTAARNPAQAFWIIKHGIKASGMPAWGQSMDDASVWDLVAFVTQLPVMTGEQYAAAVEASEGHAHAGADAARGGHTGVGRPPAAERRAGDSTLPQRPPGTTDHAH